MLKSAEVVIIGGGVIGCAVAFYLAKKGTTDVVLLEKKYLTSGSTGTCAAGVRAQWGTEMNCRLSRDSINIFKNLDEELGCKELKYLNKGYLLTTYDERQSLMLEENLKIQHSLGIPSKKISAQEAKDLVPYLNTDNMVAGFFNQEDGHIDPFKVTFAYAKAAERLGVKIYTYTEVTGIKTENQRIKSVITAKGEINTNFVVNASGPYAKLIGQMLGLHHPVEPVRHQILITEPMEYSVEPAIMSFHHNSFCQQVAHGGFIMLYGNAKEVPGWNFKHEWWFLEELARKITEQLPVLRKVNIVRQWAGHYDVSPDGQPILGPVPGVEGYYLALGCGKGFMLAPIIGKLISEYLLGEETSLPIDKLNVERFGKGELLIEPAVY